MICRGLVKIEFQIYWRCWCLVEKLILKSRFWRWNLIKLCEIVIWPQEVTLVRWTQPSGPLCLWQCFFILSVYAFLSKNELWSIYLCGYLSHSSKCFHHDIALRSGYRKHLPDQSYSSSLQRVRGQRQATSKGRRVGGLWWWWWWWSWSWSWSAAGEQRWSSPRRSPGPTTRPPAVAAWPHSLILGSPDPPRVIELAK